MSDGTPDETGEPRELDGTQAAEQPGHPGAATGPPPPGGTAARPSRSEASVTAALGGMRHAVGPLLRRVVGERSSTDVYVAGVLGGQAERFQIDPLYLRIGVVVAAVLSREAPFIPPLYALAWVLIPKPHQRSLLGSIWRRSSLQEVAAAALSALLASLVLADERLWVAAVLALLAWALLDRSGRSTSDGGRGAPAPPTAQSPEVATSAASAGVVPASATEVATAAATGESASPGTEGPATGAERAVAWGRRRRGLDGPLQTLRAWPRHAARSKRQPALWPLGLAAMLAATVVFWTVDRTSTSGLDPSILVNLGLIIIGAVIALSGWRGRVGLLPLLVIPLAVPWLAFSVADIGRFPGDGEVVHTVTGGSATDDEPVEVGYGTVRLVVPDDQVEPGETIRLTAGVTAGRIVLEVPENTNVLVDGRMGMGSVVHRSRYRWNTSFVVQDQLDRRFSAVQISCGDSRRIEVWEAGWTYPGWSLSFPILTADGSSLSPEFLAFLDDQALPAPELHDSDPRSGSPHLTVIVDQFGQACDPAAPQPEAPATVILDATLGLGELTIVHDR